MSEEEDEGVFAEELEYFHVAQRACLYVHRRCNGLGTCAGLKVQAMKRRVTATSVCGINP